MHPAAAPGKLTGKSHTIKRVAFRAFLVLFVVWGIASVTVYREMLQPPETFGRFMMHVPGPVAFLALPFETMWLHARAGTLQVGDPAPDFSLMKLDKSGRMQLSDLLAEGPVVLVFGSYT